MTKDLLPDEGGRFEGEVGDSIAFITKNFTEMNKLWVRMQHGQGLVRDPARREEERRELNVLVCKNLNRLSSLDGLTIGVYRGEVLPSILDQVTQCQDQIAQSFLMDSLIQAISDEYHLRTLDMLFDACNGLEASVDVHSIVISLIRRLTKYLELNPHAKSIPEKNMFTLFYEYIEGLTKNKKVGLAGILALCGSLLQFALSVYPDEFKLVGQVYDFVDSFLSQETGFHAKADAVKEVIQLLQQPVTHYGNVLIVLKIKSYNSVLQALSFDEKREVSKFLIKSLLTNQTKIQTAVDVDAFFTLISVIIKGQGGTQLDDDDEYEEDQSHLAQAISLFVNDDVDEMGCILLSAHEHLKEGGKFRIKYTLVPLVFKSLALVQRIYKLKDKDEAWDRKAKKIFKFANDLVGALKAVDHIHLSFRLYLECAIAASRCGLGAHAYGLLTKGAIELYESDAMSKSTVEFSAIRLLIATVNQMDCFDREKRGQLAKRLAQHSVKLINLDDQSRVLQQCSLLFASRVIADAEGSTFKDTANMSSCLKRAMTTATDNHDVDLMVILLVELLDTFLYFFIHHPDVVSAAQVTGLITKVKKEFTQKSFDKDHQAYQHLKNIKSFIAFKQIIKNNAKPIIEAMEAEYYVTNPLPACDPKDKAKMAEREKIKEQVRNKFKPDAEVKAKAETEKWKEISF